MHSNPLASPATPTASERITEILSRQATLGRCCWNTLGINGDYDSSVSHHLANLMSTAGAALENFPYIHRELSNKVVPIIKEEWLLRAIEDECQNALKLFARTTVPASFRPGLAEEDYKYRSIRMAWINLCDTPAQYGGTAVEYGILAAPHPQVPPVSGWFVQRVARATRVFGFRRKKYAREVADDLWREAFTQHKRLRPAPSTTDFGNCSS